jgi:hypothetical protein
MKAKPQVDLAEIKIKFEEFRAGREGKERIPEELWAAAVALLAHYSSAEVCQQLRIKPAYLRARVTGTKPSQKSTTTKRQVKQSTFLTLTEPQFTALHSNNTKAAPMALIPSSPINSTSECRIVIERGDGSRLTLNLPVDWPHIEAFFTNFLRG